MGISNELKKYLLDVKKIPKGMYNEIKRDGVLSGSFVLGGYTEGSDIDVLLHPKYCAKYKELFSMRYSAYIFPDYRTGEFLSFYVKDPRERALNLIVFFNESDYEKYLYATRAMRKMKGIKEYDDLVLVKIQRVQLFELFKEASPQALSDKVYERAKNWGGTGYDVPF